jgi:hypothetical protein
MSYFKTVAMLEGRDDDDSIVSCVNTLRALEDVVVQIRYR